MTLEEQEKEIKFAEIVRQLRDTFTANKIQMTYDNPVFVWSEKFFWIGLTKEQGVDILPTSIRDMLIYSKSPVMEYKVKRIRTRKKKQEPPDLLK
jgi:hypothetical protein